MEVVKEKLNAQLKLLKLQKKMTVHGIVMPLGLVAGQRNLLSGVERSLLGMAHVMLQPKMKRYLLRKNGPAAKLI